MWSSRQRDALQTADESSDNSTGDKKEKKPTFVLESADCLVNFSFFSPHAGITTQGPEFLVGTKCHY